MHQRVAIHRFGVGELCRVGKLCIVLCLSRNNRLADRGKQQRCGDLLALQRLQLFSEDLDSRRVLSGSNCLLKGGDLKVTVEGKNKTVEALWLEGPTEVTKIMEV